MTRTKSALDYWATAEAFGADFEGSPCMVLPNKPEKSGYVRVRHKGKNVPAHRLIYEAFAGRIPPRKTLDHRCAETNELRACVNWLHLEPATVRENVLRGRGPCANNARKIMCIHGHELAGENLRVKANGERACRTCERANGQRWREQNRARYRAYNREWQRARRATKKASP